MELSDVYLNQINKKRINNLNVGSNFPQIERDQTILNLENAVFSKMNELLPKQDLNVKEINSNKINFFSFEDAIKELQMLSKR